MVGIHHEYTLGFGLLLVFFGIGMIVISWRAMRSGEGQYDADSTQRGHLFNLLGIVLGSVMTAYGGWLLWLVVPEYLFW